MLLSVIMTNYNHGHFLEKRLSSILEQLPENSEIVVVDDKSTDNSIEIIRAINAKDKRIRLIENGYNKGIISSVNLALNATCGKYVVSLAADDRILPGFIEKTMKVLLAHPTIPICCSDCGLSFDGFLDKDPEEIQTTVLLKTDKDYLIFLPQEIVSVFKHTSFWIPGHSSIIKREALLKYGGFKESLKYLCDWFLLHTIALNEGVAYIPQTLSIWRQHNKTYSSVLATNEQVQRQTYFNLFHELDRDRRLKKLFRKAALLHFYLHRLFRIRQLCLKPQYWIFLGPIVRKAIKERMQRKNVS